MDDIYSRSQQKMRWDSARISGFDWDAGNQTKNSEKYAVSCDLAEQVFLNAPLKMLADPAHSKTEPRLHAFGKTDEGRLLPLAFTVRENQVRVILPDQ